MEYWEIDEAVFSAEQRRQLASKGQALPDGSYPIRNKADLSNALQAFGRAKNKAAVKRHIIKRARALGATDMLPEDWNVTEADKSLDAQQEDVRSAWREASKSQLPGYEWDSWPVETYSDHVIVRMGEDYWSVPYSADGDEITFDKEAATKVERQWSAVEASADAQIVGPVAEADGEEPTGAEWDVIVIKVGESKNGFEYSAKALKAAVPLFEGARVLGRSDEDHLARRNKSVEKIVGWLSEARFEKGAIRARLHISESAAWLRTMLVDAWKRGKKDLVGLSIVGDAIGKRVMKKGREVAVVEAITKISTVDVVVDPAAGGGLLKLVAAVGKEESVVDPKIIAALQEAEATVVHALLKGLSEEEVSEIKEAHPELAEKITEAMALKDPKPAAPAKSAKPAAASTAVAEAEEDQEDEDVVPVALSRFVVKEALAETKLPELVRQKISKSFAGKSFKMEVLESAISDEIALWKELEKEQVVVSAGETREPYGEGARVVVEEAQRAKAALDGLFMGQDEELEGEKIPRFRSIREAYVKLTGDTRFTGRLPRKPTGALGLSEANGGRVRIRLHEAYDEEGHSLVDEKGDIPLAEAISTTQFDVILGDSVTRRMLRDYARSNLRDAWAPIVDIVPISDFRTQRRERWGGYGNLPTVAQAGAYAALTSPTDEEVTYAPTKRGGTETINLEAIVNDDLGAIRNIPRRLARAAAQTLHEFLLDFMRLNSAIYDSVALAAAGHGNNISAVALSLAELAGARKIMRKQTEMDNSKALGLVPAHLLVPPDLEQLAYELTASDLKPGVADNDANYVRNMSLDYAVVDYWSDTNNWWLTSSIDQVNLIEAGFLFGEEPEIFTQDMPNVGSMFSNDQLTYKIRHVYGGAVLDFRGFFGGIVA
jgi:hypothetical protein